MASKLNMVQSFPKTTLTTLAPYPESYQKELLNNIYDQNIQKPSSSFALPDLPNNYLLNRSTQKRLSAHSLDDKIKQLLHEKLVRQIVGGRPFETIKFHRRKLIKELADWMGIFDDDDSIRDENALFRHKLISLLATVFKQNVKDIPLDNAEWTKLLNRWLRANTSGAVISSREIYKILAVDGFRGFRPKDLKFYLPEILLPLRKEYELHVRGIRNMYSFFDKNEKISSLTGTDSACVIFIAVLDWYSLRFQNGLMLDDQISFQVQRAKSRAEGYLQQHGDYFRDIKNVDEDLLKKLGNIYAEQFQGGVMISYKSMEIVGRELLTNLNYDNQE